MLEQKMSAKAKARDANPVTALAEAVNALAAEGFTPWSIYMGRGYESGAWEAIVTGEKLAALDAEVVVLPIHPEAVRLLALDAEEAQGD